MGEMRSSLKTLLSIAGSDSVGGAGIQADIRAGSTLGLHVCTAVTAITAQNSNFFYNIEVISPSLLKSQLDAILGEVRPDAVKIGMIGSSENARVIAETLKSLEADIPVVIDPIVNATVADEFLWNNISVEDIRDLYLNSLFPLATVVTPNFHELGILSGKDPYDINPLSIPSMLNCKAVVIKGGHTPGDILEDILIVDGKSNVERHPRLKTHNLHGTGCVYSSLLTGYLALGNGLAKAFKSAVSTLHEIIGNSGDYNLGRSVYGPLNINNYRL